MQAVQSYSSQHTYKRLEDLEEAFEDSKAERNSLSHQIEQIVEFVQGLHSILQQTQQRLDALESFQATVATHQNQLSSAPEGLLDVQATVAIHQHQFSAPERLFDMEQACTSQTSGSHRDQPNLPGLRPPHLGSHHSSTVQAATLKRSSSAPASLLTSHLHAITMRATVSPLLPEDRPSHKAKTGFLGLRDINADGGIPARHASAVHAVQEQLLPFVKPSEGDTDAALSDSSAQDALGKSNQTGTLCSSTPDSLSQNSHRTVCDIGTAVADVSRDTGSKACANSGSSTEASNTSVALDAVTGQMCKASSTAPSGSDSNNVRSSFAVAAHSAPSQPMSSATAAAATVASDEVVEKATAQQGRLHESVTAAFAAEGNAGKSIAATAALAEGACGHAAQDRLTFVSPFQHASMQHVPTIPPSSASSMAVSDDELAHDEHSSAERFTAAVRTTRVLPDQDEIAHDTPSSSQKPTAAVRTVTVLPDQDDALGCALAAEQSFLSMGAGSLCGGSEFSASEDYGGLVCFNEGVQVAPPPLDDAVEEGPCGMYRPQQSGGFHPQQDVQSSLQYPKGDMQRAGSHFEPSSSGPSREGYPPFGPNSLLGYHEREWLQSMEDSEAVSQHSQSGQQRPMSCDEAQWQQSLETRSASSQQQQPQGMMHAPGDDSTNPHAGTPDAHLNESAESHAGMSGEYARISLDGAGHENWKFCLRRRVQQGPSGRHGTVVDDRAHSVDVTVSSRKLHRAAMSDAKRAFLLSRAEAAQGEWPLQRMKKRRVCRRRLEACQPARSWWQLLTG